MTSDRQRVVDFLSDDSSALAIRVIDNNPWFCERGGFKLETWSAPLLHDQGLESATLHIVGSAATGFSLHPGKAGRPFRMSGGVESPSDIDMAIVDDTLFRSCWDEMVGFERRPIYTYLEGNDRERVYWGRIDDHRLPYRAHMRTALRVLVDAVRRSAEFRGYPASVRVYRRHEDLLQYMVWGVQKLRKSILP